MKILWIITLAASVIFVIQSILTFLGADTDADLDTGASLLSFRNFVNFFLGFGWTAILMNDVIGSKSLLITVSALVGIALVAAVMMLFKWLSGMQQDGNIDVFKMAAHCQGTVYLTIPERRSGKGKIQITINNSVREYNAVTDGEALKTGTPVRVVEAVSADTLLVEKSSNNQ